MSKTAQRKRSIEQEAMKDAIKGINRRGYFAHKYGRSVAHDHYASVNNIKTRGVVTS